MSIINECLKYAINNNTNQFNIDDVYNCNQLYRINKEENLRELEKAQRLFTVTNENIQIQFKLAPCKQYNEDKNHKCEHGSSCSFLHICKYELRLSEGCQKPACSLDHGLGTAHNLNILKNQNLFNVDVDLLRDFCQNFSENSRNRNTNDRMKNSINKRPMNFDMRRQRSDINNFNLSRENRPRNNSGDLTQSGSTPFLQSLPTFSQIIQRKNNLNEWQMPRSNFSNSNHISKPLRRNETNKHNPIHLQSSNKNNRPTKPTLQKRPMSNKQLNQVTENKPKNKTSISESHGRTIEVDLPENFIKTDNKDLLFVILTNEGLSGGGKADQGTYQYLPDQKKAFITYDEEAVAQRVVERGFVKISDNNLQVKYKIEKNDNSSSQSNQFDNTKMLFRNVPTSMSEDDIKLYATKLTDETVDMVLKSEEQEDCWLIFFNSELNFAFANKRHRDFQKTAQEKFKIEKIRFTNKVKAYVSSAKKTLTDELIKQHLVDVKENIIDIKINNEEKFAIVEFNAYNIANKVCSMKFESIEFELYFETLNTNELSPIKQKIDKPSNIVKCFEKNKFLKLILTNIDWKMDLFEKIKECNSDAEITNDEFIVKFTLQENDNNYGSIAKTWYNKTNSMISKFIGDFNMQTFKYDDDLTAIISKIKEFNSTFRCRISYEFDKEKKLIRIVEKRAIIALFIEKNPSFELLNNKRKNEDKEEVREMEIPKLSDLRHFGIFNEFINKIKEKYNIESMVFDGKMKKIHLKTTKALYDEIVFVMKNSVSNIVSRRLDCIDKQFICLKGLNMILNTALKTSGLLCTVNILSKECTQPGAYLIFFKNCPSIDCPGDSVFNGVENLINHNFDNLIIDLKPYSDLLHTSKWNEFRNQTLNDKNSRNYFCYSIINNNDENKFVAFGKNEFLLVLKTNIEYFLENNKMSSFKMSLSQDEIRFFKYVAYEVKKKIEDKYSDRNLKFEFQKTTISTNEFRDEKQIDLYISNCSQLIFDEINDTLKAELNKMKQIKFDISNLPGISKIVSKKNLHFKEALTALGKSTKTFVEYDVIKETRKKDCEEKVEIISEEKVEIISEEKNYWPKVSKKDALLDYLFSEYYPPLKSDIIGEMDVCKSKLSLLKGNIIEFKGDVIVNSTIRSLKLHGAGIISKTILEAAGLSILHECNLRYPHGIDYSTVATTSSGSLKNIRKIYHIAANHFHITEKSERVKELRTIIRNCLNQLKTDNLKRICIPSIGVGNLSYPADLASELLLKECIQFMVENSDDTYDINFILFENSTQTTFINQLENFKSDVAKINKKLLVPKLSRTVKPASRVLTISDEYTVRFKIIGENDTTIADVKLKITNLINEYILRDNIKNEAFKKISEDQFEALLKSTPDIEIKRVSDSEVSLNGYKDDVIAAREQIKDMIISFNENIYKNMKSFMKMSSTSNKNVQWEYNDNNEWKQFNLYMNSIIENAYSSHEDKVELQNEDDEEIEINFLTNCYFTERLKSYPIRRTEINTNSDIKLPQNWTPTSASSEYELVSINKGSAEYTTIYAAFSSKLEFIPKNCEIERVQNERLYKQYIIHKDYLRKKNGTENEMLLFHGTRKDQIESICKYGFNRSYCGVNGVAYGHGVYFALNSSYSNNYAKDPYVKKMFYCQVLVGQYTLGDSSMKVPSKKGNGEQFDSTSNSSGTIFVVYNDNQCYPQYLITYTQ